MINFEELAAAVRDRANGREILQGACIAYVKTPGDDPKISLTQVVLALSNGPDAVLLQMLEDAHAAASFEVHGHPAVGGVVFCPNCGARFKRPFPKKCPRCRTDL